MNIDLDNFWSGEWQSTWTLKDGQLSGDLRIRAHYFEMGNMQFNLDKAFTNVAVKDITNPKDIIDAIKKIETKVSSILVVKLMFFDSFSINTTSTLCTITSSKT